MNNDSKQVEPDRLESLIERRDRLNAAIQKLNAQRLAQERRDETRRKIIAGAVLLEAVDRDRSSEKPSGIGRWWEAQVAKLTRPHDRRLFGLETSPRSGAERDATRNPAGDRSSPRPIWPWQEPRSGAERGES